MFKPRNFLEWFQKLKKRHQEASPRFTAARDLLAETIARCDFGGDGRQVYAIIGMDRNRPGFKSRVQLVLDAIEADTGLTLWDKVGLRTLADTMISQAWAEHRSKKAGSPAKEQRIRNRVSQEEEQLALDLER